MPYRKRNPLSAQGREAPPYRDRCPNSPQRKEPPHHTGKGTPMPCKGGNSAPHRGGAPFSQPQRQEPLSLFRNKDPSPCRGGRPESHLVLPQACRRVSSCSSDRSCVRLGPREDRWAPRGSPLRSAVTPRRLQGASGGPAHPPLPPHSPPACSTGREITAGQGEMAECQVPREEGAGF